MKKVLSLCLVVVSMLMFTNLGYAVTVPAQTSIFIIPTETITSKMKDVNTIPATIQNDVVIDNVVVFRAGDQASLNIGEMEKARCWGSPGKMIIVNGYAYDAKGNKQKILYSRSITGDEKTWPKVVGIVSIFALWPLIFFGFVHGGQAKVSSSIEIETSLASQYEF